MSTKTDMALYSCKDYLKIIYHGTVVVPLSSVLFDISRPGMVYRCRTIKSEVSQSLGNQVVSPALPLDCRFTRRNSGAALAILELRQAVRSRRHRI